MKIRQIAAGSVAAAAVAVAGIGWTIARKLTAPPSSRVFDLTVRNVDRNEGRTTVDLDRTTRTTRDGRYNLWLEGGGWVYLGEIVHTSDSVITRVVEGDVPAGLMAGIAASVSGTHYLNPGDAGLDAIDVATETPVGSVPAC